MHATLHQLLILRDQVIPDSEVFAHVQECVECRTELNRLQKVTTGLRDLQPRWSAPDRWSAIHEALLRPAVARAPERERRHPGWLLPAASAAAVVVAVVLTINMQRGRELGME